MTLCWAVFTLWFAASLWGFLQPSSGGPALLSQLLLLLFVALHGSLSYGWRGTAAYVLIAGGVSMLLEITSVNFGFPFGFYTHHTPGQVLGVPLIIPLVLRHSRLGALGHGPSHLMTVVFAALIAVVRIYSVKADGATPAAAAANR